MPASALPRGGAEPLGLWFPGALACLLLPAPTPECVSPHLALHPREYPDFYRKLYGLLDPSVFHVKYRARFFHLADLFLSSS